MMFNVQPVASDIAPNIKTSLGPFESTNLPMNGPDKYTPKLPAVPVLILIVNHLVLLPEEGFDIPIKLVFVEVSSNFSASWGDQLEKQ
jgi:hypothetical protein